MERGPEGCEGAISAQPGGLALVGRHGDSDEREDETPAWQRDHLTPSVPLSIDGEGEAAAGGEVERDAARFILLPTGTTVAAY